LTPEKISQQDQELAEMEAAAQQRRDRAEAAEKARREKVRRSTGHDYSLWLRPIAAGQRVKAIDRFAERASFGS
jgi:hypothetical protein